MAVFRQLIIIVGLHFAIVQLYFLDSATGCHLIGFDFFLPPLFLQKIPPGIITVGGEEVTDPTVGRVVSVYQSTCHKALTHCQTDLQCRKHLEPFLRYCNGGQAGGTDTCHRDLCMQSLQGFYKDAPLQWSLEVAFCVCKLVLDYSILWSPTGPSFFPKLCWTWSTVKLLENFTLVDQCWPALFIIFTRKKAFLFSILVFSWPA